MAVSLNDLKYAFYGRSSSLADAEYAFMLAAYNAGVSGSGIVSAGYTGAGSPEGAVTATVGSLYRDTTNGVAYIKQTGVGNTGWGAVGSGSSSQPGLNLAPTAVKTANYNVAAGDFVPANTSGGGFTLTLPTAPADKTTVGIKLVTAGNNLTVNLGGTDVLNKAGGVTTFNLTLLNQAIVLQYQASTGIWYTMSAELPLSAADARYDAAGAAAAAQAASQPVNANLTSIAALTTTSYGRSFLDRADAAAGRTYLGLGTAATAASGSFLQTANNLSDVTAATARTNLGLDTMATQAASAVAITGGTIGLGAGAVGTPSLVFGGDTTTGFYRSGANVVALAVSGALGLSVAASTIVGLSRVSLSNLSRLALAGMAGTASTNGAWTSLVIGGTDIFDSASVTTATWTGLTCSASIRSTGGATMASAIGLNFSPTVNNDGATPSVITTLIGVTVESTLASSGGSTLTLTDAIGFRFKPVNSSILGGATVTALTGLYLDKGANYTATGITTARGVYIKTAWASMATTNWGLAVENVNSYHQGKLTLGAADSAATWLLHVQGGNSATSGVGIDVSTTGPTVPGSSASGVISIYKGATNWYFLITFNDAGTTRYKYLQLNATGVTWVNNTVLPT